MGEMRLFLRQLFSIRNSCAKPAPARHKKTAPVQGKWGQEQMSQITELEGRLSAALDRIGVGVDALSAPATEDPQMREALDRLEAELADERVANAQLEERVKALTERQETTVAELQAEMSLLKHGAVDIEAALQQMRSAHAMLEASSAALRHAAAQGVSDPEQINAALAAELDAVRAARAADVAEAAAILGALEAQLNEEEAS